ncbi:MAG: hypothetical protein ACREOL_09955 [Candidatus Dormibacteria bacterium]
MARSARPGTLDPAALREALAGLERVLESIRRGELSASNAYVSRLEGAVAALYAVLGSEPPALPLP